MGMRIRVKDDCHTLQNGDCDVNCSNSTVQVKFNLTESVTVTLEFDKTEKEYFLNSSVLGRMKL